MASRVTTAFETVHAFLRERRDEILHSWEELVVGEARRVELTGLALRDSIPPFLDELADWLESGAPPGGRKVGAHSLKHVVDRLDRGLDLGQVLREYRLLREAILRCVLAAEQGEQARAGPRGADGRRQRVVELARLNAGLDIAISGGIEEFVIERDRRAAAERELADAAARESEERYRTAFRAMEEGFALCELIRDERGRPVDYRFTDVNPAFGRHSGIPSAQVVGRLRSEVNPAPDDEFLADCDRVVKTRREERVERYDRGLGRWFSVGIFPRAGDLFAYTFTDVTTRHGAEERLRASESRQVYLVALGDALRPLLDPGEIQATACRLLGERLDASRVNYAEVEGEEYVVTREYRVAGLASMAGRYPIDSFRSAERTAFEAGRTVAIADIEAEPGLTEGEAAAYRALGVRAFVSVPLVKQGALAAVLSAIRFRPGEWRHEEVDLVVETAERTWAAVERARAEAGLRESEASLRELDRRKTDFLAVLSHELRNPLAPIRNAIYLLQRAAPGSEPFVRAMKVIERQTVHLSRLVDDLLDVVRITRGRVELRRGRVDLRELVRQAMDDVRQAFAHAGIELRVEYALGPTWLDADPTRIAQVVGNLLHNAQKFTPAGGTVTVSLASDSGKAYLRVKDTGVGMEPGREREMFEAFAQGEQGLARTKGGLGLGLSLVKLFVELHGGAVSAASAGKGLGTEFLVTLPLATTGAAEPRAGERREAPARRILVIEDNADTAQTLADVLALNGHVVQVAKTGGEGIGMARDHRPDVVLCDIGLPDIDGYEVARQLRATPGLEKVRLVALSGYALSEDRERAEKVGFDAHVSKPPDLKTLARVVGSER